MHEHHPLINGILGPRANPLLSVPGISLLHDYTKNIDVLNGGKASDALTVTRASSGIYEQPNGDIVSFGNNEARIGGKGILVEAGTTNLLIYSDELESWGVKVGGTINANSQLDISGGVVSLATIQRGSTSASYTGQSFTKSTSSLQYIITGYAKKKDGDFLALRAQGAFPARCDVCFDLSNGTVSVGPTVYTGFSSASASIEETTIPGIYKFNLTVTSDASASLQTYLSARSTSGVIDGADPSDSVDVYAGGIQVQQSDFETLLVPTSGSSATKAADDIIVTTPPSMSGDISVFLEWEELNPGIEQSLVTIDDGSTWDNVLRFSYVPPVGQGRLVVRSASATVADMYSTSATIEGQINRIAGSINTDNSRLSQNGQTPGADLSMSLPTGLSRIQIGDGGFIPHRKGMIRKLAIFDHALTIPQIKKITSGQFWRS